MRAVVNLERAPHRVEMLDRRIPEPGPDDVLLRVRGVGVCGSDLHQWHNTHGWPVNYPVVLGHEFAGEIAAVGANVHHFHEGDRVTSETAASICGVCVYCRSGNYNLCPHRLGFGYGTDGAMAEYVRVPARCLHRVPDNVPFEDAALTEPACVAANAILELSHIRPADFVVVIGPGPIGLMALQMCRLCSPSALWIVGRRADAARLEIARKLGATRTLVVEDENVLDAAREQGDGMGAHLVVDCVGISATLKQSLDLVRPAGQITKIGWGPPPVDCSLDPLIQKAARLQGSFSHTWQTWERVLQLYSSRQIQAASLRRTFPLESWLEAFQTMDSLAIPKSVLVP